MSPVRSGRPDLGCSSSVGHRFPPIFEHQKDWEGSGEDNFSESLDPNSFELMNQLKPPHTFVCCGVSRSYLFNLLFIYFIIYFMYLNHYHFIYSFICFIVIYFISIIVIIMIIIMINIIMNFFKIIF